MNAPTDAALVLQCLNGDRDAFGVLVERYQRVVYNIVLRVVRNRQDADDVAQSVFIKAYERLNSYKTEFRFYSWIYRIAMNESLNFVQSRKVNSPILPEMGFAMEDPEMTFSRNETAKQVEDALLMLTPEDCAIILLKHFENFSYDDIGFVFDIPVKTVKSRLYTARQRLKDVLLRKGHLA